MNDQRRQQICDLSVFALLIAIGVVGRWGQPQWCFTPIAAAAIFAGFYFSYTAIAVLVPLATLGVSDLALPLHNNIPVLLATYAIMTAPVWLGRMLREPSTGRTATAVRFAVCGFVPATLFYLVSNFAVWAFQSDYEKSLAGLAQCYTAALPFYRWMLAGDVFYIAVLCVCFALAGFRLPTLQHAPATAPRQRGTSHD